jgi:hypothetical protein
LLPASIEAVFGDRVLLIAKSALFWTSVVAVAELLPPGGGPGVGSAVALDTVAVLVMVVPLAVPAVTFTTTVKIEEALATCVGLVNVNVPVPPAGTASVRLQPAGVVTDTSVVFAGTASESDKDCASLGPLLVTVIV